MRAAERAGRRSTARRPPMAARPCSMPPASSNYNNPDIGMAARKPCWRITASRPRWSIRAAAACRSSSAAMSRASPSTRKTVSETLLPYIDEGYDVIALVPSCALMLKFEWPLILPEDAEVKTLSEATYDISRIRGRDRRPRRPGAGPEAARRRRRAAHRLPRPRAEHGAEGGGDAAPDPRARAAGDRALLRPWRLLGRDEGAISTSR